MKPHPSPPVQPAPRTSVLEYEDAYEVDNEASNRDNQESVMFDLGRLERPLQGKTERGSQLTRQQLPEQTHLNGLGEDKEGDEQEKEGIYKPSYDLCPHEPVQRRRQCCKSGPRLSNRY